MELDERDVKAVARGRLARTYRKRAIIAGLTWVVVSVIYLFLLYHVADLYQESWASYPLLGLILCFLAGMLWYHLKESKYEKELIDTWKKEQELRITQLDKPE